MPDAAASAIVSCVVEVWSAVRGCLLGCGSAVGRFAKEFCSSVWEYALFKRATIAQRRVFLGEEWLWWGKLEVGDWEAVSLEPS
jgi:hypothetical protein